MNNSDALVIARANDLITQCKRSASAKFSAFLDGAEQRLINENVSFPYEYNVKMFGGWEDAERKILGVFPEWEDTDDFPISVLKITSNFSKTLTHRDYLGTLMAQGIDRNKTGDIIIDENTAYVFVCEDIASYLADNIHKIGNQGISIEVCGIADVTIPEKKRERIGAIAASTRLDAVTAAICNLSRSASAKLISSALVKVNYKECLLSSYNVKENDLISVRGYGRFVFLSADGETRKGRLHITAEKYI